MNATAAVSTHIARIVATEVEGFMEREKSSLNQKNLRQLEKEIDKLVNEDPKVGPLLLAAGPDIKGEKRDLSVV